MRNLTSVLLVLLGTLFTYSDGKATNFETADCSACHEFVQLSRKVLHHLDDLTVKESLIKWCKSSGHGSNHEVCSYMINDFYAQFDHVNPETFCTQVNACSSDHRRLIGGYDNGVGTPYNNFNSGNKSCDFCVDSVISVKEIASFPQSEAELKYLLTTACNFLGAIKDECVKVFNANLNHLVDFVVHRLDPLTFCRLISLCGHGRPKSPQIEEVVNLLPVGLVNNPSTEPKIPDSKKCIVCRAIAKHVYDFVGDRRTEAAVRLALGQVCTLFILEGPQRQCLSIVRAEAERLVELLVEHTEPELVCVILGYCIALEKGEEHAGDGELAALPARPAFEVHRHEVVEGGENCMLCKMVVSYVLKELKDNKTEEGIIQALDRVCVAVMPAKDVQECESFVQQYTNVLINTIEAETDPQTACNEIGLCPKKSRHPPPIPPVNCQFCKLVVETTLDHLKDKSKESITKELERTCEQMHPGDILRCRFFVKEFVDKLVDEMMHEEDPKNVCTFVGLCATPPPIDGLFVPYTKIENTASRRNVAAGPNCMLCKLVLGWVYKELKDSRTEEDIISALDAVCDAVLPQRDRPKCEDWVQRYTEQIINIVTTETDPELACALLGQCMLDDDLFRGGEASSVVPFTTIQNIARIRVDESPKLCGSNDSTVCDLCKDVFTYVQAQVKEESTKDEIQAALDQACAALFPGKCPERPVCEKFVSDSVTLLIEFLEKQTDPTFACSMLHLCPNATPLLAKRADGLERDEAPEMNANLPDADERESFIPEIRGALCDICRQIFTWLNERISDKKTEEEIIGALDQVCSVLFPGDCPEKPKCIAFVNENTRELIDALSNGTKPEFACGSMRVCKYNPEKEANRVQPEEHSTAKNDEVCYICQLMSHYIQEKLYDHPTEQSINNFIENELCDRFKQTGWKNNCDSFIDQYAVLIEQTIAQKVFDPYTLCDITLKVCAKNMSSAEAAPNMQIEPKVGPKLEFEFLKPDKQEVCEICMGAVNELDRLLESGTVEKELSKLSAQICKLVPEPRRVKCKEIVNTFGPTFFRHIGQLNDAKEVCKAVDLCYIPGQVHLLGGRKCSYGPTYWCHTSAHAHACKATNYCTVKIWKPIQNSASENQ